MDKQREKLKIYICSSVGMDYFFFLEKIISHAGYEVVPVWLVSEHNYRVYAKTGGFRKRWLRLETYLLYPFKLAWTCLKASKGSVFIVTSNTFYAPYLAKLVLSLRNIRVLHLLYDLYPDAIEVAGKLSRDSAAYKILAKVAKLIQLKCDGTIYLGRFLQQHAEARWGVPKRGEVIDISVDLSLYQYDLVPMPAGDKIVIHYGGQLGYMHDAVSIIACVKEVLASDLADKVEFNFYVSGAQADFLKNSLKEYPIKVISAIPSSTWREHIKNFHVGLVSLSPGGATVCLPSKTYGMMAGGLPIIGICPEWSDVAGLVRDLDAGWVVNNSPSSAIENGPGYLENVYARNSTENITSRFIEVIREIVNDPELLERRRRNAYEGVRKHFNLDALASQWQHLISRLENR